MSLNLYRRPRTPYWIIRGSFRGIPVEKSTGHRDRKKAQQALGEYYAQLANEFEAAAKPKTRTFGDAAVQYLEDGGAPEYLGPILKRIAELPLHKVGQEVVDNLAKELKPDAEGSTKNRQVYTPIIATMRRAAKAGWCDRPEIKRPQIPEPRTRSLTPDEARRLIANAGLIAPLIAFLLNTGARIGEALKLDWRHVDLVTKTVSILAHAAGGPGTKTKKSRVIPLNDAVVEALTALPHRDGLVFRIHYGHVDKLTGDRRAIGPGYADREGQGGGEIKTAWKGTLRRAGISDLRVHDLRHAWATEHYRRNRNLAALQKLGGWRQINSVFRYAHASSEEFRPSVENLWKSAPGPTA